MSGAADLLYSVWRWIPELFLLDYLIVSSALLWSRKRNARPAR